MGKCYCLTQFLYACCGWCTVPYMTTLAPASLRTGVSEGQCIAGGWEESSITDDCASSCNRSSGDDGVSETTPRHSHVSTP